MQPSSSIAKKQLLPLYRGLREVYGDPGPWPWFEAGKKRAHTAEEIVIGAILAQNTSWRNVEYALENLRDGGHDNLNQILLLGGEDPTELRRLVRPAGFYNQKAERLLLLATFIQEKHGDLSQFFRLPLSRLRNELLLLKGIGKETADTILLYAGNFPIFVVDAYTRRFVRAHRLNDAKDYDLLQTFFMQNLPKDTQLYRDFHALIVEWGKNCYPNIRISSEEGSSYLALNREK